MKKIIWSLLCFVLISTSLFSQRDETVFGRTGLRISGAWGGSSNNFTQVGDDLLLLSGGYGGLEFNKSVFIGWAAYGGSDNIQVDNRTKELCLRYNGPIVTYTPISWKVVHPRISFMGASGRMNLDNNRSDRIGVFQPSVGAGINVFRWFRIGLDAGYRVVTNVKSDFVSNKDMSGIFGEIKLKFGWSRGR